MRFSVKVFSKTIKVGLTSDISDIKIGLKSGNPIEDFFHYSGSCKRYISVYSNRCTQTKVSDKVFRLC